jgi:hypothetical protein
MFKQITEPTVYELPALARSKQAIIEISEAVDITHMRHLALSARIHDASNLVGADVGVTVRCYPVWPADGDPRRFPDTGASSIATTAVISNSTFVGELVRSTVANDVVGPFLRIVLYIDANGGVSDYVGGTLTLSVALVGFDN